MNCRVANGILVLLMSHLVGFDFLVKILLISVMICVDKISDSIYLRNTSKHLMFTFCFESGLTIV